MPPFAGMFSTVKERSSSASKMSPLGASIRLLVPTVTVLAWWRMASTGLESSSTALPRVMSSRSRGDAVTFGSPNSLQKSSMGSLPTAYFRSRVMSEAVSTFMDVSWPDLLQELNSSEKSSTHLLSSRSSMLS
ncbi:MAG: hypothetical protein BWY99_02847 [Synergistetes bacterium ADurb.BinA166]|nr:MAG: hypothetical protein BWY99_02847 [Synergistetes bacterium ADurb.BinA166]